MTKPIRPHKLPGTRKPPPNFSAAGQVNPRLYFYQPEERPEVWLVWREFAQAPHSFHADQQAALMAARRWCKVGDRMFVLRAVPVSRVDASVTTEAVPLALPAPEAPAPAGGTHAG